jgi:hypothetical protein
VSEHGSRNPLPPSRSTTGSTRRPPVFQPRFTVLLLYLFCFFALYCLLLVLPALLDVLAEHPAGPEQQEIAKQAARAAIAGKLLPCFGLALVTVAVGSHYRVLPGVSPE